MSDDVLVKVDGVSKKFCRSLKRSLWYGVKDVSSELLGREGRHGELRRNEFWAVNDVSFELKRGECLGLIGPNGAGKSTLLKMLNGLVKPDKGNITMRGRVGALIELGAGFNPILTSRENIYVNGSVLGFSKREIDRKFEAIVEFAEIEEFLDTPVQNFSSGMRVRLGFAIAAQMEPDVLVIDEVLAVGDAAFRSKCISAISKITNNASVILVSHSMPSVARVCSRSICMNDGTKVFEGQTSQAILKYLNFLKIDSSLSSPDGVLKNCGVQISRKKENDWGNEITLNSGEGIDFELSFCLDRSVTNYCINIGISDGDMNPAIQIYSLRSCSAFISSNDNGQENIVRASLDELPLKAGRFYVNVYIAEVRLDNTIGRVFGSLLSAAIINIVDHYPGFAPVQLSARWRD